jgi:hypothetical protein
LSNAANPASGGALRAAIHWTLGTFLNGPPDARDTPGRGQRRRR